MKYLLVFVLLLASCSADNVKVKSILEAEGCSNINVSGWEPFCCDKSDTFTNSFTCTRNGHEVSGCVCSGVLKGYTVRYK